MTYTLYTFDFRCPHCHHCLVAVRDSRKPEPPAPQCPYCAFRGKATDMEAGEVTEEEFD